MSSADSWRSEIAAQLAESAEVKRMTAAVCGEAILEAARLISECLRLGGKVLLCGNGGSAADAQHIAAELIGRLNGRPRPPLAALALTTDTSVLTALGNDFGYEGVFERQVEALARPGDVLIAISTSGRSANLLRAVAAAAGLDVRTVALTGRDGGSLVDRVALAIRVPSLDTQRVQEAHIAIGHVICSLVERMLAEEGTEEERCLTGRASE